MSCSVIVRHCLPAERLRAWVLESARPGLNSDSATYYSEVLGKRPKLSEPRVPHLRSGVLGGAGASMHGAGSAQLPQNTASPNKLSVGCCCFPGKPQPKCLLLCEACRDVLPPPLWTAPSFLSPSWWKSVWGPLLPCQLQSDGTIIWGLDPVTKKTAYPHAWLFESIF